MAGNYAGQKAMEQVPFVGGFLGKKAGEALGRQAALSAIVRSTQAAFAVVNSLPPV